MFAQKLARFAGRLNTPKITQAMFLNQRTMTQFGMMQMAQRSFASFDTIEKAAQKLNKALDSEIKYENENYSQLEDIETFLNESGFKFKETDSGIKMVLTKEVGDKIVEVHFEAR